MLLVQGNEVEGFYLCDDLDQQGVQLLLNFVSDQEVSDIRSALASAQVDQPISMDVGRSCVEKTLEYGRGRTLGLMMCAEAQATSVVRISNFLSDEEIKEIRDMVAGQSEGLGLLERGVDGMTEEGGAWRTRFLHTSGFFGEELQHLRHKLRQAIGTVDKEHWKILEVRQPSKLNFRTVEYHEYRASGRLDAKKHYDEGSLVTVDIMLGDPDVDFEGGSIVFPLADGSVAQPSFCKGDAIFLFRTSTTTFYQ